MIERTRIKGPAGGPAEISICLVTPGGRRPDELESSARSIHDGHSPHEPSGRDRSTHERGVRELSAGELRILAGRRTAGAKADFMAGRTAAHALLGEGVEVLRAPDGRPIPSREGHRLRGISLSIGHSRGIGMAGVVRDAGWVIGVDIETRSGISERLTRRVLTARERRRVARRPVRLRGRAAVEHWVLKEAALKTRGAGVARLISEPAAAEVIRLNRRGWGRVTLSGNRTAHARLIQARGMTIAVVLLPR